MATVRLRALCLQYSFMVAGTLAISWKYTFTIQENWKKLIMASHCICGGYLSPWHYQETMRIPIPFHSPSMHPPAAWKGWLHPWYNYEWLKQKPLLTLLILIFIQHFCKILKKLNQSKYHLVTLSSTTAEACAWKAGVSAFVSSGTGRCRLATTFQQLTTCLCGLWQISPIG